MPKFSKESEAQLRTCHPDLQRVAREAIKWFDFKVNEGHRGKLAQDQAVAAGNSTTPWPRSKHNSTPSNAMDLVPYPVDWSDEPKNIQRFVYMAGVVMTCAEQLGVKLRWGGDWNQNEDMRDERKFRDYPHFERVV